jgi:hypothetical protein
MSRRVCNIKKRGGGEHNTVGQFQNLIEKPQKETKSIPTKKNLLIYYLNVCQKYDIQFICTIKYMWMKFSDHKMIVSPSKSLGLIKLFQNTNFM